MPAKPKANGASSHSTPTSSSSSNAKLREWKLKSPYICCICLEDGSSASGGGSDAKILTCSRLACATTVHAECYGIKMPKGVAGRNGWLCDACATGDADIVSCALCPHKDGALRKARRDVPFYVHIVCALWIKEVDFNDEEGMADIHTDKIEMKKWNATCSACPTDLSSSDASFGVKIQCDAGGCKNAVHVTCAQNYGLLEEADDEGMEDPFFVFCKQHGPNDEPRLNHWARWVRARKDALRADGAAPSAGGSQAASTSLVLRSLNVLKESQDTAMQQAHTDHARALSEMHHLIRTNPRLDKELKNSRGEIEKAEQQITSATKHLDALKTSLGAIWGRLFEDPQPGGDIFAHLARPDDIEVKQGFEDAFRDAYGALKAKAPTKKAAHASAGGLTKSKGTGTGICSVCKVISQNPKTAPVIVCDQCSKAFHWACLDPPLTRAKRRGYVWRCEECDEEESEDEEEQIKKEIKLEEEEKEKERNGVKVVRRSKRRKTE
ncbi:PHD finger protein 14 [Irineochytrium annulatum]|nr:PHD finger protein 14 [Irineochytrium annulatum]